MANRTTYGFQEPAPVRNLYTASFQYDVGEWADKTFPQSSPHSILSHLAEGVGELAELPGNTAEEMADCLLLLLHLGHKLGIDVFDEAQKKFYVNQQREWEKDAGEKGYWKRT